MTDLIVPFLILVAAGIVIGLIWLSIHYYWKREEKNGRELTPLAKQWMMVSKPAGYFFFALPFIMVPIVWVGSEIGFLTIVVMFGMPGAILSMIKRK